MRFFGTIAALALLPLLAHTSPVERQAGPSGTLVIPNDGTKWHKTGEFGFGAGHVIYHGVDQDYNNGDGVTHVKTYSLDIYLQREDNKATLYLANGILLPPNLVLDQYFRIPLDYPEDFGNWRLVIDETQYGTTTTYPKAVTFQSAAPLLTITFSPSPWDP